MRTPVLWLLGFLAVWCAAAQGEDRAQLAYTAIEASHENRERPHFDPELRDIRDAVSHLRYDTYRHLASGRTRTPYGEEAELELTERHTLHVTPVSKERDGRIRAEIRVTKKLDERDGDGNRRVVNALRTTTRMAPGDPLCLGGFHLERGDLVIILVLGVKD